MAELSLLPAVRAGARRDRGGRRHQLPPPDPRRRRPRGGARGRVAGAAADGLSADGCHPREGGDPRRPQLQAWTPWVPASAGTTRLGALGSRLRGNDIPGPPAETTSPGWACGGCERPHLPAMATLSVLDLSPIIEGGDAAQSFRNSLSLAQHAEALGYRRFWLAEHHGMPGIASAATAVADRPRRGRHAHASASAPAASCCPTTRRWSSPSSSARSRRCTPAASISAWAARPAPTS